MDSPDDPRKAFLARFLAADRQKVVLFLRVLSRSGAAKAPEILRGMQSPAWPFLLAELARLAEEHPEEAAQIAAYTEEWAQKTPAAREAAKAAQGIHHQQIYSSAKPASEKQLSFWRSLGGKDPPPLTSLEASQRIDALKNGGHE